jgi:predicted nucleic acid-binding Zn ribbon protein
MLGIMAGIVPLLPHWYCPLATPMPEYCYHCPQASCPNHLQSLLYTHGMNDTPLLTCLVCGYWLVKQPQAVVIVATSKTTALDPDLETAPPPHVCSGPSCCFRHVDDWFPSTDIPLSE